MAHKFVLICTKWCHVQGYSLQCVLSKNNWKISKTFITKYQFNKLCYTPIKYVRHRMRTQSFVCLQIWASFQKC